jgi:hypothetical protein
MMRHLVVAAFCLLFCAPAQAQMAENGQSGVTFGTAVVTTSRYIWRGFEDGGFSVQPRSWIELGGFRAKSMFNFAGRPLESSAFTEQDVTVEYGRSVGAFAVSGGWTAYFFPGRRAHSQEVFASIERKGPLSPSLAVFHDYRLGQGTYANAGVTYPWPAIVPAIQLSSTISVGYNHHHWTEASGFSEANVGVRASWRADRHVAIGPFINHSRSLNRSIVPTRTYGGVEVAIR